MNCDETLGLLRDHCDGALPQGVSSAVRRHLMACADCRRAAAKEARLLQELRALPVSGPRPSFARHALRQARREAHRGGRRAWFAGGFVGGVASAAAAAVVWFALVAAPAQPPPAGDAQAPVHDVQRVGLVIQSPVNLDAVTVSLVLPKGFELAGHPGKQHLSWTTRLVKGENMLSLPILARAQREDELFVNLRHGEDTRLIRVRLAAPHARAVAG